MLQVTIIDPGGSRSPGSANENCSQLNGTSDVDTARQMSLQLTRLRSGSDGGTTSKHSLYIGLTMGTVSQIPGPDPRHSIGRVSRGIGTGGRSGSMLAL